MRQEGASCAVNLHATPLTVMRTIPTPESIRRRLLYWPEANSHLAGQAKVHDRVHNSPTLTAVLSQLKPAHILMRFFSSKPKTFQNVYASEFPTEILYAHIVSFM
jgi:hypothetical protein